MDELLETWAIQNQINLYLLDAVDPAAFPLKGPTGGRTVGAQFAHLHNVRLMWLKSARPELPDGLTKLEGDAPSKEELASALTASGEAIGALLKEALQPGGRVKGFKPHPTAFLGYLIAHEAHHRGQIVLTLKALKLQVDKKVLFGLWEWGVR